MSKEIVLVSDNHGRIEVLRKIRELHPNADAYLHCGDAEVDEEHLESFAAVKGNNDTEYDYPETRVIDLGECKILMLHGHQYFMGTRLEQLAKRARHIGCNMAFFGHTHVFHVSTLEGVLLVNPGSVYNNRDGTPPCYALIHNRDGEWKVERKPVPIKENPYWQHWL